MSECTSFYIVTDPVRHTKMTMVDANCMVSIAVNDIDFMSSMPPGLTAATGMDVLTHGIEAILSRNATPLTDKDAVWAVHVIHEYLPRAVADGQDEEARTMMAYAENTAGMAFAMLFSSLTFWHLTGRAAAREAALKRLQGLWDFQEAMQRR